MDGNPGFTTYQLCDLSHFNIPGLSVPVSSKEIIIISSIACEIRDYSLIYLFRIFTVPGTMLVAEKKRGSLCYQELTVQRERLIQINHEQPCAG